ncbi:hypothetical protein F8M41_024245 [Gigaspora margarita]|uniref:Uncharacterized protein n=1 Tax=Gigaspora margarita TaxID=4874 RepID=A0A8H4AC10_GIGMA|nr:hypothetical protein F8M41_024245 [Gigaspora margarita]
MEIQEVLLRWGTRIASGMDFRKRKLVQKDTVMLCLGYWNSVRNKDSGSELVRVSWNSTRNGDLETGTGTKR